MKPFPVRRTSLAVAVASTITAAASTAAMAQTEEVQSYSPTMLDQVTVSATRTERQLDDVASSVSVIDANDVEQRMAKDIRDMVKYEPGINVTSDSRFGLGSFNIRGMDANRVKITVDGVDQSQTFGYEKFIQSGRNYFDIENMKQVEIVKGPASTLHGSDAIGGVVAFVTKDPADYLNAEGDDSYAAIKGGFNSSDSSHNQSMTLANRSGDLESMLIYSRRNGNEQESHGGVGGVGAGREEADPASYSSDSLLGKIQYQINDDHRIGFTGEWQEGASEVDQLSMAGDELEGVTYLNANSDDTSDRKRLGFFHEWEANTVAFDNVRWSLDWQQSTANQKTYDTINQDESTRQDDITAQYDRLKDYVYEETSLQLDATFNKAFDLGETSHLLTYGFNYQDREQDNLNKTHTLSSEIIDGPDDAVPEDAVGVDITRYAPVATTKQFGFFLQDEFGLMDDRLTVTPGIRYDRFDVKNEGDEYTIDYADPTALDNRTYDSWTARIGAVYEINNTWSTFAQYSQGFSTPDLFDMYFEEYKPSGAPVWVMPNPSLEPEESDSYEIGLRANSRLGSMELTAFYNDYKNFIEMVGIGVVEEGIIPTFGFQAQNLSEATIKGIEFKSQLWLDEAFNAPAGTRLNTAIAWSEGRGTMVDSNYVVHENEPLNSIAPLKAVFALGYDSPTEVWGSDVIWTLVAAKDSSDISNLDNDTSMGDTNSSGDQYATPGYGLVDLTAYYKPHKDVTINAGIFNITDKKYWMWDDVRGLTENYAGLSRYTQPGRNFSASIKWEI